MEPNELSTIIPSDAPESEPASILEPDMPALETELFVPDVDVAIAAKSYDSDELRPLVIRLESYPQMSAEVLSLFTFESLD